MAELPDLNSGLVCKSASYNGNFKLINNMLSRRNDDKQHQTKSLGLKDFKELNYRVFHERRKVIEKQRDQFPNLQKELHDFINAKAEFIFRTKKEENSSNEMQLFENEFFCQDKYDNIPPLEYFMKVNPELRTRRFYESIKCGDVLYTTVSGYAADNQSNSLISFHLLKVLAMLNGKHKYFDNTNIIVYMHIEATHPSPNNSVIYKGFDMNDISREIRCWKVGTHLQVKVISIDRENDIIFVDTVNVEKDTYNSFGETAIKQFPHITSVKDNINDKGITYPDYLEKSSVYNSKLIYKNFKKLVKYSSSLMDSLSLNKIDNFLAAPMKKSFKSININEIASTSVNIKSTESTFLQKTRKPEKRCLNISNPIMNPLSTSMVLPESLIEPKCTTKRLSLNTVASSKCYGQKNQDKVNRCTSDPQNDLKANVQHSPICFSTPSTFSPDPISSPDRSPAPSPSSSFVLEPFKNVCSQMPEIKQEQNNNQQATTSTIIEKSKTLSPKKRKLEIDEQKRTHPSTCRIKLQHSNGKENNLLKDNESPVELVKDEIYEIKPMEKRVEMINLTSYNIESIEKKNVKKDNKVKSTKKKKGRRKSVVQINNADKRKTKGRGTAARKNRTLRQCNVNKVSPKKRGRPRKVCLQKIPTYNESDFLIEDDTSEDSKKNLHENPSSTKRKASSTSECSVNEMMPFVTTCSQSYNHRASIGRKDFGTLVFAKIKGWRHWPAMIVDPKDAGLTYIPQGSACIFWIGDFRVSSVSMKDIKDFVTFFREDLIRPSVDENYINSVMIALKECCRRAGKNDVDMKDFGALLSWATSAFGKNAQIFRPTSGSSNYPPIIDLCLSRIKKFEESQTKEGQRAWKKKVELLHAVRNESAVLDSVCISCNRPEVTVTSKHPVFEGGACRICMKEESENKEFPDFNEIKHIFCIICRCPCTEFTCDIQTCKMVYCEPCIEMLANVNAVETAKNSYLWRCYACLPYNYTTHGLFKKINNKTSKENTASQNEKPAMMWGEYLIEEVVSKRVQHFNEITRTEYLIKWQGLSPDQNTWEPEEHMFGIQSLLREYKRHLNSAPSSNIDLDESTGSSREESMSSITPSHKRKRVGHPKVPGNAESSANDVRSPVRDTKLSLSHGTQVAATKQTNNSEKKINSSDYGSLVWAKIQGFPWWPAMIVKEHLCGFPKMKEDEACVFWFGDNRVSKISLKDVREFTKSCKESMFESSNDSYMRAMAQALRICHERFRDSDVYLYTYEEFVCWARKAFKKDPQNFRHISDLDPYPPKINEHLKTIMNYREAQKEEKWEEIRWKHDPRELPKDVSSISSVFGKEDWTASKSFSSYDPNTPEECISFTEKSRKSYNSKHFKSKSSFASTSTSLDSEDVKNPITLKMSRRKQKVKTRGKKKMLETDNSWEVEKIIKHRKRSKVIGHVKKSFYEYLIKWCGYTSSHNSWEPRENLIGCKTILEDYVDSNKKRKLEIKNTKLADKQKRQALMKAKNKQRKIKKETNYTKHKESRQVATKSAESTDSVICGNTFDQQKDKLIKNETGEDITEIIQRPIKSNVGVLDDYDSKLTISQFDKNIMKVYKTPPRPVQKKSSAFHSKSCEKSDNSSPKLLKTEMPEIDIDKVSISRTTDRSSPTKSPLKGMIMSAINDSVQRKLKIQEIYDCIKQKIPEFGTDLKNRKKIRDILSHNKTFVKTGEENPAHWKIATDCDIQNISATPEESEPIKESEGVSDNLPCSSSQSTKSEDFIEVCELRISSSSSEDEVEEDDDDSDEGIEIEEELQVTNFQPCSSNDKSRLYKNIAPNAQLLNSNQQKIYILDSSRSKLIPYEFVPTHGQTISLKSFSTGANTNEKSKSSELRHGPPPIVDLTDPPMIDLTQSPTSSRSKLDTSTASTSNTAKEQPVLNIKPLSKKKVIMPLRIPFKLSPNLTLSLKKSQSYKSLKQQSCRSKKDVTVFRPLTTSSVHSLPSSSSKIDHDSSKDNQS